MRASKNQSPPALWQSQKREERREKREGVAKAATPNGSAGRKLSFSSAKEERHCNLSCRYSHAPVRYETSERQVAEHTGWDKAFARGLQPGWPS